MKKYSILSVANKQYTKFAYVFIQSAIKHLNLDNVHEICILETGMDSADISYLTNLHPKIKFINGAKVSSSKAWDDGWQENVLLKTNFAKEYISNKSIPACMIDIDCMFVQDISSIITADKHDGIVLCDRSEIWGGMPYIASFVGFVNIEQSLNFINDWILCIDNIKGFRTKETPALNEIIRSASEKYDFYAASHDIVGLYVKDKFNSNSCILHFKGGGDSENIPMDEAVQVRFKRFPQFENEINEYLENV